jgi:hypothetical protein
MIPSEFQNSEGLLRDIGAYYAESTFGKDAILRPVAVEDQAIISRPCFPTLDIPNRGATIINEFG